MSESYKFRNPEAVYFVSFAVVDWMDVFTRKIYLNMALDCLRYCQENKGLELKAWVIMTNHMHLVFRSKGPQPPQLLLGDFKRFTGRNVMEAIRNNRKESRREWLMEGFRRAAEKSSNVGRYQFWRHENHPVELCSPKLISQKVDYVHNNPVKAGFVEYPEDYLYSSARDYFGRNGLLKVVKF